MLEHTISIAPAFFACNEPRYSQSVFFGVVIAVGAIIYGESSEYTIDLFVDIAVLWLGLAITFMAHIAVHELGHVIFGEITGYRFGSCRLFNYGICKRDGKW